MEERFNVNTPESVSLAYQVAGIGSRFIAALIDTIILALALLALLCGLGALSNVLYSNFGSAPTTWVAAFMVLILFGLTWGYYILFEVAWNGQTPGKRAIGLRVLRTDGTPITLVDSIIRNLVRIIDFLPLYYAVGLVTMFLNTQSRRLGDLAAGTLVVKERRDVTLKSIQPETLPAKRIARPTAEMPTLNQDEYRLIQNYLSRRHELRNRAALAWRIATAIATEHDLPRPASPREAEALLLQLARRDATDL